MLSTPTSFFSDVIPLRHLVALPDISDHLLTHSRNPIFFLSLTALKTSHLVGCIINTSL